MTEPQQPQTQNESERTEILSSVNVQVIESNNLFAGQQEVLIRNGDELYRLRRTRSGKLILCK